MLWFLIAIIITIYVGFTECFEDAFWTFFTGFIIAFALTLFSSAIFSSPKTEIVYEETTYPIIALKDNSSIQGRTGMLGAGYVQEKMVYTFMYKSVHGLTMAQIPANESYIHYSNENPRIIKYHSAKFKNKFLNYIAFPMNNDFYYIYIPEGSIITNYYQIDLE